LPTSPSLLFFYSSPTIVFVSLSAQPTHRTGEKEISFEVCDFF
jgi:hypothetical protein